MEHIRCGVPIARISPLAFARLPVCPFGIWHCPSSWQVHNFSINASSCKQTKQAEGLKKKAGQKNSNNNNNRRARRALVTVASEAGKSWCSQHGMAALSDVREARSTPEQHNQLSTQAQQHLNANANGHKAWGCAMRALYAAMWAKCEQRTRRLSMVRECQCAVCSVQCGCYWAGSGWGSG